jgi:sugar phosphate isomerase/epimerase
MASSHTIAFINDELKAPLASAIAFAHANKVDAIEVRSIEGRNFIELPPAEQRDVAGRLKDAGLKVVGLASPLLKWDAPGRASSDKGDQFGFDIGQRTLADVARLAVDAAHSLGTRNVRIFSYLTYAGFTARDLAPALDELLRIAEREDLVLHVENEAVCNIMSDIDLLALAQAYRHPRLKVLLDIGNIYAAGIVPDVERLKSLMPHVDHMHFKDVATAGRRRVVPLGDGEIPYPALLSACLSAAQSRTLTLSVETHVPENPIVATQRSLDRLREMIVAATA